MANTRRIYRVSQKIREIVSQELLRTEDPRLSLLSVTSVAVSKDLRIAKVYWVPIGGKDRRDEVEAALKGALGYIRGKIGKALGTKFVPELRFYYDDTYDTAKEVDRLMGLIEAEPEGEELP